MCQQKLVRSIVKLNLGNHNRVYATSTLSTKKNVFVLRKLYGSKINEDSGRNSSMISSNTNADVNNNLDSVQDDGNTIQSRQNNELADNDGMQIPLFTGVLILIVNLALTVYGFYVFFTGNDPLFSQSVP
jgi:hypothetical protein